MRHTQERHGPAPGNAADTAQPAGRAVGYRADVPTPDLPPSPRPWTLAVLVAIVLLEAAVLVGFAVFYAVELLAGNAETSPGGAAFTLVLLAAFGAWLASAGAFLWRGRRWPRSAALVAQLFALVIGVPTLTGGVVVLGFAIVLPALVALFLLFEKRVLAATQGSTRSRDREGQAGGADGPGADTPDAGGTDGDGTDGDGTKRD